MHKLFADKLARATGASGKVDLDLLAELVSEAFAEFDSDRQQAARSMTLMTEEVDKLNRGLEKTVDERIRFLRQREDELLSHQVKLREQKLQLDAAVDKLGILCVDLDRFKEVNDVFGHAAGDRLLQKVAARFKSVAEEVFVARLGGDEFSIVVTDGQQPAATEDIAERLQAAMVETIDLDGRPIVTGVSIGVAIYPNDGTDASMLLANGDAALYRAKNEGRGRICFFDDQMDKELREQRLLQHELRFAIDGDQLRIAYQPQALNTGGIIGFEALVRWQHPKRGMIGADVFIQPAESSGLIIQLGEWVLREACREAASWDGEFEIAVNLSPVQFKHGDLPTCIHSILMETGLAPARLALEITEGVLISDFSRAVSILRRLKTLGVKIILDDFGTGFSSLSYLHAFPFDKIKIDRSFLTQQDKDPRASTIIRTIIGLAHGLSLPAVAEGVETEKQLKFLQEEGCDEVQGFLIGRPLAIDSYAEVVGKALHPDLGQKRSVTGGSN